jgi:rhamnulokinase
MLGRVDASGLDLSEVHRFHYPPRTAAGHLRWDMRRIRDGLDEGLRDAADAATARGGRLDSIGVDSWAVDYGVVDASGRLLEDPVCYRDARTAGVMDDVFARLPRREIFARTGIQFLALNTLYQLFAHVREGLPAAAARLLMIPDLCHHHLCGALATERTNASTTQLLDTLGGWDESIFRSLELPRELMPEIVPPGTELGRLGGPLSSSLGPASIRVVAPATHDTACAVAGTPLAEGWAYVSSGTWSLVGVERNGPLLSEDALAANFTNEAGIGGTVRFLKNVMGLWILESCRREWESFSVGLDYQDLLARVAATESFVGFVYPDDPRFFNPPRMTAEVQAALAETGQPAPEDPVLLAKVVLDSLALRYASVVETIVGVTGSDVRGVHIVGGGSRNEYLNQATADATGRLVLAGPDEATAAGNVLVQSLASGEVSSLAEGRRRIAETVKPRGYEPRSGTAWATAAARYREVESKATSR